MKKIAKLITLIILGIMISGCSNSPVTEISYSDLEKKLENNESFILEILQDGCHNCESFSPKFQEILKDNNLTAVSINLTNISDEENDKLDNLYNITGTPTVIFIEEGKEPSITRRIVGDVSEDRIISKLQIAGYINE